MSRQYKLTTPVHPEQVVDWFLGLHHYWFDESLGSNAFTGMRDLARNYLTVWVETGELPPSFTQLQIHLESKFNEWLQSSWEAVSLPGPLIEPDMDRVGAQHSRTTFKPHQWKDANQRD